MRGCWHFGAQPVRLAPGEVIGVRGTWATVASLFAILGGEVMAEHGYLAEVWDEGIEDPAQAEPWPVVDILDDGRVVARRVPRGYCKNCEMKRFQPDCR
jgi:hypothetical protein